MFETLTQEYEMAKVQEAKEIPSVKVLDPPNVPERKSFPPRAVITLLGAVLAFSCGSCLDIWPQGMGANRPGQSEENPVARSLRFAQGWPSLGFTNGLRVGTESRGRAGPVEPPDAAKRPVK